jgi:hypothetical protein
MKDRLLDATDRGTSTELRAFPGRLENRIHTLIWQLPLCKARLGALEMVVPVMCANTHRGIARLHIAMLRRAAFAGGRLDLERHPNTLLISAVDSQLTLVPASILET